MKDPIFARVVDGSVVQYPMTYDDINVRNIPTDVGIDGQDMLILGANGDYVWRDIVSNFTIRGFTGGNNPSSGAVAGNIQGLLFNPSTMSQVWCDFHIEHDIALNTKIYPHVHWCPITNRTGVVRWGIEYTVAKGHGQQAFHAPITIYIDHPVNRPSNLVHFVSEATEQQAILSTNIEPDSFVKTRIFRDAAHPNDTFPDSIHAWACDLHYQAVRIGTKNKAPNFFL